LIITKKDEILTIESPAFAESIKEGDVTFLKKVGDAVAEDEEIAKVETDKTTIEVKSPKSGVIEAILVPDGSTITANMPIIKLRVGAAGAAAPKAEAPAAAAGPKKEEAKPAAAAPPPPPPQQQQQARVTPVPSAPSHSIPVAQVPVTPFVASSSAPVDISKISGTRAETKVIV
jgi:pyruvate/2-oxoglutarate dehydrogenase complex dihydrolipoamide acyltransferase (E2) component